MRVPLGRSLVYSAWGKGWPVQIVWVREVRLSILSYPPRLVHLEANPLDDPVYNSAEPRLLDARNVVYIARATVENTQVIAAQIKNSLANSK